MTSIDEAFNSKFNNENITKLNNVSDVIDYFFTQRKVTEYEEYIDEKSMQRKKRKNEITYNFIAINIPHYLQLDSDDLTIDIKIWGDENYKYTGNMRNVDGNSPGLLLKLGTDKQLFINLKLILKKTDDTIEKEYVTFINIPKRYQIEPRIDV